MTPLHCQATATILLLVLPTVSALVPSLSIRQIQSVRNSNAAVHSRKIARASTQLSLGIDPTDIAQHAHLLHQTATDPTSTFDLLSSFTLAKASVLPNESLAPLSETIKSTIDGSNINMVEVIPDMTSMPGGASRSGNSFLAGSFREMYDATIQANPAQTSWSNMQSDGSIVVPARELDVIARYADLLDRIPLAAAVYALVDFFLINAEEDLAIAEFLDEDAQVEAIMDVENKVLMQRFMGLFMVVIATVSWSYLSYHPVPFNEL
mmetsp:Transcript_3488/g.7699  ORF Transcript_3488/g.7699 Transcript_3488/m.7699 type:complete len:265 (-) Transcript_3488:339-1133(-)|eukprot:CAMPEP_0172306542 /NCGR_PEP_ID=MMETSP1058-20130122/7600_1 /TAXON_ID=83371 /ORGANISM="Detonula confervacea, Strain CCMP 353" /LENGTH=264 /DNA_ID=CAMNT_0013018467 /DNA_START=157 /DNA_END=951 /DNA_ORIENTATION=+